LWDFFATKLCSIMQSYMHITWIQTLFTQTVIVNYSESARQGFQSTSLHAIKKELACSNQKHHQLHPMISLSSLLIWCCHAFIWCPSY
jgi:hypothetical protein